MWPFLLACQGPPEASKTADTAAPVDTGVPRASHALVIVLDGTRFAETFGTEPTEASSIPGRDLFGEFTRPMLPVGTLFTGAVAANLTVTPPAHADIVAGRHNSLGLTTSVGGGGYYRPEYPTIFEAVESTYPGSTTSLVCNTVHLDGLERSLYPGNPTIDGATLIQANTDDDASDQLVIDALYVALSTDTLVVSNLHDIDRGGHSETNPTAYTHNLQAVAGELARLWAWIESDASGGLAGNTLLVVTADHGRHDWEDNSSEAWDYSGHGDQCAGCRDIPIFMAGPGVKQGVELDTPATLEDVSATVAAALGVAMPHATGRVLAEAYDDATIDQAGTGWIAVSDDGTTRTMATIDWTGDPGQRASISQDGIRIDTAPLLAADPENLALGNRTVTCWRELGSAPTGYDWNWKGRCELVDEGTAQSLTVPLNMVSPNWRPALLGGAAGDAFFAWAENPTGVVEAIGVAEVRVAKWAAGDDWSPALLGQHAATYPGNPSLARAGERLFVAWAASDAGTDGSASVNPARYTRHVEVAEVGEVGDDWTVLWRAYTEPCPPEAACYDNTPTVDDNGEDWGRMEFPALAARDDGLDLAWVSWGESGSTVHLARSDADFGTWSTPIRLDDTGRVLGHVEPRWQDGTLYYARLTMDDTVEACAWRESLSCVDTGATAIVDLAADRDGAIALLYREGNWAAETVSF